MENELKDEVKRDEVQNLKYMSVLLPSQYVKWEAAGMSKVKTGLYLCDIIKSKHACMKMSMYVILNFILYFSFYF